MGGLNNSLLEANSINKFERVLMRTRVMKPILQKEDKIPLWDGEVFLYANEEQLKRDILDRIPVQVKSTQVDKLSKGIIYHQIEVCALEKYYDDGGIFYVKAEVREANEDEDDDEVKLYYSSLLPLDLKKLIEESSSNGKQSKTKQIKLKPLPSGYIQVLEIIKNFSINKKKQGILNSINIEKVDYHKIKEVEIIPAEVQGVGEKYYTYGDYEGIQIPLNFGIIDSIIESTEFFVKLEDKNIKIEAQREHFANGDVLLKLYNISFRFTQKSTIFNFKTDYSNIEKGLKSLYMMREIIIKKKISINGIILNINNEFENLLSEIEKEIKFFTMYQEILKKYKIINTQGLSDISPRYISIIQKIYEGIIINKEVESNEMNQGIPDIYRVQLEEESILVFEYNNKIYDFYESFDLILGVFVNEDPKNRILYYPYLSLKDFLCTNFSENKIVRLFKELKVTEEIENSGYFNDVVNFILALIKSYDISNNEEYLSIALDILEYFKIYIDKEIYCINKAQILKRITGDILELTSEIIRLKETGSVEIKCCCCILLNSSVEYEYYYNQLDPDEQEEFQKYPISKLLEKS